MRGAHLERNIEAHVTRTLQPRAGETLLLAASGGPDSSALVLLAAGAAARAGARVVVGHVNHSLRERAWQDEAVVLALGASLGLRVWCMSVEPGSGSEAVLRRQRYAALLRLARAAGATRVCTAHHAEDQTETVLLALFRGSGLDGLAGMEPERRLARDVLLIRPLLRLSRQTLRAYCLRQRLPYAHDASNQDPKYRRNALRSALAPLRDAFPHLDEAVARCAHIVRDEAAGSLRAALRSRLRSTLAEGPGGLQDVTFERIEAVVRLAESGSGGRVFVKDGLEVALARRASAATLDGRHGGARGG